jgi:hypothetical protein
MRPMLCLTVASVFALVIFSDNVAKAQDCDHAAKSAAASSVVCDADGCRVQPLRRVAKAATAPVKYFQECKPVRRAVAAPFRFFKNRKPVRRTVCGVARATKRFFCGCNCSR